MDRPPKKEKRPEFLLNKVKPAIVLNFDSEELI